MSEIQMKIERTPAEIAASDVREAIVRYVRSAGLAGVVGLEAEIGAFAERACDELVAEGVIVASGERGRDYRLSGAEIAQMLAEVAGEVKDGPCGTFGGARFAESLVDRFALVLKGSLPDTPAREPAGVSDAGVARRLAEYALGFVESWCGPDVDALAERFGEILSGKRAEGEEQPAREAAGMAPHPFAKPADDEPSRLDEAIEKARAFVFPALGPGHGLLLHWLTELRDRRRSDAILLHPEARHLSGLLRLLRDCLDPPAEAFEEWKGEKLREASRLSRDLEAGGRMNKRLKKFFVFVREGLLGESPRPPGMAAELGDLIALCFSPPLSGMGGGSAAEERAVDAWKRSVAAKAADLKARSRGSPEALSLIAFVFEDVLRRPDPGE